MRLEYKRQEGGNPVSGAVKTVLHTDYAAGLKKGAVGSVKVSYKFDGLIVDDEPFGKLGEYMFELPGAGLITEAGKPALIREGLYIAIPKGAVYDSAQVETKSEETLKDPYPIMPMPTTGLEDEGIVFRRDEAIYGSMSAYPADTPDELKAMCGAAVSYANNYNAEVRHTAVFGAYYRTAPPPSDDADMTFVGDLSDCVRTVTRNGFTPKSFVGGFEDTNGLIGAINAGAGFVNYRGHGNDRGWGSSIAVTNDNLNGAAGNPQVAVGTNAPHVFSIACLTANLLYRRNPADAERCFGETWIKKLQAVSFLGATRTSYRLYNSRFNRFLWEAIVGDANAGRAPITVIGDIYLWASVKLFQQYLTAPNVLVNLKAYLLLGDATADYLEQPAP